MRDSTRYGPTGSHILNRCKQAHGESVQQRALLGLCAYAIDDVHVDLQHTKRAASQVYQGTKAVARECTKAVLEAHDAIQQTRVDTNMALKQVA